eukprot:gene4939-9857_t
MAESQIEHKQKINEMVLESFQKVAEIVLLSKGNSSPLQENLNALVIPKDYTHIALANSWASDPHAPIIIEIFYQSNSDGKDSTNLIEKWRFCYTNDNDKTARRDSRLNSINRRLCILQRTLYCYVRMLPAFTVCAGSRSAKIKYRIRGSCESKTTTTVGAGNNNNNNNINSSASFQDTRITSYSFSVISTIFGNISLSVEYLSQEYFKVFSPSPSLTYVPMEATERHHHDVRLPYGNIKSNTSTSSTNTASHSNQDTDRQKYGKVTTHSRAHTMTGTITATTTGGKGVGGGVKSQHSSSKPISIPGVAFIDNNNSSSGSGGGGGGGGGGGNSKSMASEGGGGDMRRKKTTTFVSASSSSLESEYSFGPFGAAVNHLSLSSYNNSNNKSLSSVNNATDQQTTVSSSFPSRQQQQQQQQQQTSSSAGAVSSSMPAPSSIDVIQTMSSSPLPDYFALAAASASQRASGTGIGTGLSHALHGSSATATSTALMRLPSSGYGSSSLSREFPLPDPASLMGIDRCDGSDTAPLSVSASSVSPSPPFSACSASLLSTSPFYTQSLPSSASASAASSMAVARRLVCDQLSLQPSKDREEFFRRSPPFAVKLSLPDVPLSPFETLMLPPQQAMMMLEDETFPFETSSSHSNSELTRYRNRSDVDLDLDLDYAGTMAFAFDEDETEKEISFNDDLPFGDAVSDSHGGLELGDGDDLGLGWGGMGGQGRLLAHFRDSGSGNDGNARALVSDGSSGIYIHLD